MSQGCELAGDDVWCMTHGTQATSLCSVDVVELRRALEHAETFPEIHPLNYHHDAVVALNQWAIEQYQMAKALLTRLGR